MAGSKQDSKRGQILAAAARIFAEQGLSAPTAAIAREAGVANGTLFNCFPTKTDLLNALYRDLKSEMATAALAGMPAKADIRERFRHAWTIGLRWTAASPEKRRALAHLSVSPDLTPESLQAGHQAMAGLASLLDESRRNGPMRDAPLPFVAALLGALTDATADFMIRDPANAEAHCAAGFEALWRIVA